MFELLLASNVDIRQEWNFLEGFNTEKSKSSHLWAFLDFFGWEIFFSVEGINLKEDARVLDSSFSLYTIFFTLWFFFFLFRMLNKCLLLNYWKGLIFRSKKYLVFIEASLITINKYLSYFNWKLFSVPLMFASIQWRSKGATGA